MPLDQRQQGPHQNTCALSGGGFFHPALPASVGAPLLFHHRIAYCPTDCLLVSGWAEGEAPSTEASGIIATSAGGHVHRDYDEWVDATDLSDLSQTTPIRAPGEDTTA
ncbi:MAG: hypothetical protein QOG64_1378 [Acidimicrobiaceae bacterium]|nr:hypothetical protein [Acidimicrobiaceae bacterium]